MPRSLAIVRVFARGRRITPSFATPTGHPGGLDHVHEPLRELLCRIPYFPPRSVPLRVERHHGRSSTSAYVYVLLRLLLCSYSLLLLALTLLLLLNAAAAPYKADAWLLLSLGAATLGRRCLRRCLLVPLLIAACTCGPHHPRHACRILAIPRPWPCACVCWCVMHNHTVHVCVVCVCVLGV